MLAKRQDRNRERLCVEGLLSKWIGALLLAPLTLLPWNQSARAQTQAEVERYARLYQTISWHEGPCVAQLGTVAQVQVPSGYRFTGPEGARIWAEMNQNPPVDELGVLAPSDSLDWYLTFAFADIGYVPDDDWASLDAPAIFEAAATATELSNAERRARGWQQLHVTGWIVPPCYDGVTHNLNWALRCQTDDGQAVVNYNTRVLGRGGVMKVNLVVNPELFSRHMPTAKGLITGIEFNPGQRYGEWRAGDKVASYGLAGLISGGVVATAAKNGLLSKLGYLLTKAGKAIIALFAGLAALFGWLMRGRRPRKQAR